jgi:hypothetical protein
LQEFQELEDERSADRRTHDATQFNALRRSTIHPDLGRAAYDRWRPHDEPDLRLGSLETAQVLPKTGADA